MGWVYAVFPQHARNPVGISFLSYTDNLCSPKLSTHNNWYFRIIPQWTCEYQGMSGKTKRLFIVRLVGQSKGTETEHLAFDKP